MVRGADLAGAEGRGRGWAPIAAARAVTAVMRAAGLSVRGTKMVIPSPATAMVRPVIPACRRTRLPDQRVCLGGQPRRPAGAARS